MEDYTYISTRSDPCVGRSHARGVPVDRGRKASLEMHPLGIGGKEAPARLVFTAKPGPALNAR